MKKFLFIILICLNALPVFAQHQKKSINATRITEAPKIDGKLDEAVWQNLPVATDFTQTIPYNGRPGTQKTVVKIVYDDEAIYFGAMLYDSSPDSILTGLGRRDAFDDEITADLFIVELNPYNDDQMLSAFKLSASGVQIDEKVTYGNWDKSWDAVWYSNVSIVDSGWIAEVKIPYSALRLPSKNVQTWGLHLWRCLKRKEEWTSWNFVNEKEESTVHQVGQLTGIEDVKPPVRLSFTPYFSTYWLHDDEKNASSYSFKGGLDLKYGINESFTLDMMLIPDFGQVQSDDPVLNLSTVETYYNERRGFFTEGTELFNKAGIFYSRRIGAQPTDYWNVYSGLNEQEEVVENPSETQILNATKVSGRTNKGLGIGFLNAITTNTYAKVRNNETGEEREVKTQVWTNYSVVVLDQALKNNSSISLINTNVDRFDDAYVANVTGIDFKFANKNNTYAIFGRGALSLIYNEGTELGHFYNVSINKIKGDFKFGLSQTLYSDTYNPTDLGYLANNNQIQNSLSLNYDITEPFWHILSWYNNITFWYDMLYKPMDYARFEIDIASTVVFRNQLTINVFTGATPIEKYDHYEPRVEGWKVMEPTAWYLGGNFRTDQKKLFSLFVDAAYWETTKYEKNTKMFTLAPSLRLNNKLTLGFEFQLSLLTNAIGFASKTTNNDSIFFGRRDIDNYSNTITGNYIFNNKSSISLRARHYQSKVEYKQFYILNRDGTFNENYNGTPAENINYNTFNVDLIYTWQFAPGSELSLMWKNDIMNYSTQIGNDYFADLNRTWNSPQKNTLSFKLLYYLDYQYLRRKSK
jgi:hypothetical protein